VQLCWYDGECYDDGRIPIAANDPGLMFGATVFSTMRIYGKTIDDPRTAWPAHRQRLETAIAAFSWSEPDWMRIDQGLHQLAPHYPLVRVTLFPDGRELVSGRFLPEKLDVMQREGITVWVAPSDRHTRSLAAYKTGNYLGAWSALQIARSHGNDEAILTDAAGHWLETSTGNLWGYRDRTWYTPPIDGSILPGIVRQRILDHLRSRSIAVNDRQPWTPDLYRSFEIVAYSNSGVEIVPIVTVRLDSPSDTAQTLTFPLPFDQTPLNSLRRAFDACPAADEVLESPSDGQMN
jgi:4-amino-4-deoxychorismate lyase